MPDAPPPHQPPLPGPDDPGARASADRAGGATADPGAAPAEPGGSGPAGGSSAGPGASEGAGQFPGDPRAAHAAKATERARRAAAASARAARTAAGGTSRAAKLAATGTSRAARAGASRLHRAAEAQGAGQTGLSRMIELNAASAFADALVAVALAGTLFFAVPTAEARGNVALYLALTMAPFAIVAPIIGPFLDRFRHGRRWAIGVTAAGRGFLAWVAADAVLDGGVWLYPAALGVLVGQKAYAVTRAAAVPRLLPHGVALVAANSRLQLAATLGTAVGAPIGIGLAQLGPDWPLRAAFLAYVGTTVLAILLPTRVDSAAGESGAVMTGDLRPGHSGRSGRRFGVGGSVVRALRANAALRMFSGFLTMFLAFVLREEPVAGIDGLILLGIVAAAAWLGSTGGTSVGAMVRARSPDRTVLVLLGLAAVVALVAAVWWSLVTVLVVALVAGFAQQLGRLSLDAIVQRDVPEHVRSNAFARSETLLQLSWVVGGAVGIVLPLVPALGLGLICAAMVGGLVAATRVQPTRPTTPPSATP